MKKKEAVILGRLGGLARARKLSHRKMKKIAQRAAMLMWRKRKIAKRNPEIKDRGGVRHRRRSQSLSEYCRSRRENRVQVEKRGELP